MRLYELKPHQIQILNELKTLPQKNLHYYVIQQSLTEPNLTLNELKKYIKRSIKYFIKDFTGYNYRPGLENEIVKYYCFFETTQEFFNSQNSNHNLSEELYSGLHFHLFISSPNCVIHLPSYTHYLFTQLTSQKNKRKSITKFDYSKIEHLDEEFINYHTKQMMYRFSPELVFKNI